MLPDSLAMCTDAFFHQYEAVYEPIKLINYFLIMEDVPQIYKLSGVLKDIVIKKKFIFKVI